MTTKKKLKRRARALRDQRGTKYTTALELERAGHHRELVQPNDPLERAMVHRRELVQLAADWSKEKPLDPATLRRVAMRPVDWQYQDEVQQAIPFPDAARPGFIGVLLRAEGEVRDEYSPPPWGERPKDPKLAIRELFDRIWHRIALTKRARAEALEGLSVEYRYGPLLSQISCEVHLCAQSYVDTVVEPELRRVLAELERLNPREPESSAA